MKTENILSCQVRPVLRLSVMEIWQTEWPKNTPMQVKTQPHDYLYLI